jgi:hypothetical protein
MAEVGKTVVFDRAYWPGFLCRIATLSREDLLYKVNYTKTRPP